MKKLLCIIAVFITALTAFAVSDEALDAINGAVDALKSSNPQSKFGNDPVAILPVKNDSDGMILSRLKIALTNAGVTVVEGKEDPVWDEILKEIAWDERKDDILDPLTLVKFGRLKAARYLVYGSLIKLEENTERVYCEIELHGVNLLTKEHVWGGTFVCRQYKGKDIVGIISLDGSLRDLLKKNFAEAKDSILSAEYQAKLSGINSVTVIPLAGDIDQYMTGLAIEILTQTRHTPKLSSIGTVRLARSLANNNSLDSNAIFYGAVRDLSRKALPSEDNRKETAYEINADIQLFLEDAKTGGILWSKTVTLHQLEMEKKILNDSEKVEAEAMGFLEKNWKLLAAFVGVFILIIAVGIAVGIARSATNVR